MNEHTGGLKPIMLEPDAEPISTGIHAHIYDRLLAGIPPGSLLLMLEGHRPVVSLRRYERQLDTIARYMRDIGEQVENGIYVLYPLDVTRKLAAESNVLGFEFPPEVAASREVKWKVPK